MSPDDRAHKADLERRFRTAKMPAALRRELYRTAFNVAWADRDFHIENIADERHAHSIAYDNLAGLVRRAFAAGRRAP